MPPRDRFEAWFDGEDLPPATSGPSPRYLPRPGSGLTRFIGLITACVLLVGIVGGAHRAGFIRVPGEPGVAVESPTPTPTDGSISPTPTSTPTAPPTPDIAGRLPAQDCKLASGNSENFTASFPITALTPSKTMGTIRIALIFVDFPDVVASADSDSYFDRISSKVTAAYSEISYGKLTVEFVQVPGWIRMSKASSKYNVLQGSASYDSTVKYGSEALTAADRTVDMTGVTSVAVFAVESAPGVAGDYEWDLVQPITTGEGSKVTSFIVTGGQWWLTNWEPLVVAHEFGHVLGLQDLYGDEDKGPSPYVGDFDFMSNASEDSVAPSLLGWDRWRLGWISDASVVCVKPTSENRITLSPLQTGKGTLLAVVPLSATRALVMESRHPLGMDRKLRNAGILVYVVDTSIDTTEGPMRVQLASGATLSDALLQVDEYLEASGWVVSVTRNEVWGNEFAIFP
jgi:M6 family metalloprotease-like protein